MGLDATCQRYVRHHVLLLAFGRGHVDSRLDHSNSVVVSDIHLNFIRQSRQSHHLSVWWLRFIAKESEDGLSSKF